MISPRCLTAFPLAQMISPNSPWVLTETLKSSPSILKSVTPALSEGARRNQRHSGLCGQAPSDYPDMAEFLVELGIDSISLTPDSLIATTRLVLEVEQKLGR